MTIRNMMGGGSFVPPFFVERFLPAVLLGVLLFFSGCASGGASRSNFADSLAETSGFNKSYIRTDFFTLLTYSRFNNHGKVLVVYIEVDGAAWSSRSRISDDPTPKNPVSLRLAIKDRSDSVLYIARPCQYIFNENCEASYWGQKRFSQEVLNSINMVIDLAKKKSGTQYIEIVGVSGGGVVSALLSAIRNDVKRLTTFASPIDVNYWTGYHSVSPIEMVLSTDEIVSKTQHIEQFHFAGEHDEIVPPELIENYVKRFNNGTKSNDKVYFEVIRNINHTCCEHMLVSAMASIR